MMQKLTFKALILILTTFSLTHFIACDDDSPTGQDDKKISDKKMLINNLISVIFEGFTEAKQSTKTEIKNGFIYMNSSNTVSVTGTASGDRDTCKYVFSDYSYNNIAITGIVTHIEAPIITPKKYSINTNGSITDGTNIMQFKNIKMQREFTAEDTTDTYTGKISLNGEEFDATEEWIKKILPEFSEHEDKPKSQIAIITTKMGSWPGTSYLQAVDDFTPQSVDYSSAIEIPYYSPCITFDNNIFVMPGTSSDILRKYTRNYSKELVENGQMLLPNNSWALTMAKESDKSVYVALWRLGKIWVINPTTLTKIAEIDISSYGVGDSNPAPSAMCIRDGKLFVGLHQENNGYFAAENRPFSDVLIINTGFNSVEKMITDSLSGISMPTALGDHNSIFVDEHDDIYVVCVGAYGYYESYGHKAGILRIKSGETEFDENYKFTITGASAAGEVNTISYLLNVVYMDDGKLYANAVFPAYYGNTSDPYEERIIWPVLIDLRAQTITKLPFTKRSSGFACISVYNEKIIFGMSTDSDQGFYSYDPLTGEASSKPVITTTGYPSYFIQFKEN